MPDPMVREIGRVTDLDGIAVSVGVDHDAVTIARHRFNRAQRLELIRLVCDAVIATYAYQPEGKPDA
jgi:hypothetical protein